MIKRFRRWLAAQILGEQFLMVTPTAYRARTREGFLGISDAELGQMYRTFYGYLTENQDERALVEGRTFETTMTSSAVLWLASKAAKSNAQNASFTVRGTIDGGKTLKYFGVYVALLPNDHDMDGPRIEATEEDGKITKLTVREENPGYYQWAMDNRWGEAQ